MSYLFCKSKLDGDTDCNLYFLNGVLLQAVSSRSTAGGQNYNDSMSPSTKSEPEYFPIPSEARLAHGLDKSSHKPQGRDWR